MSIVTTPNGISYVRLASLKGMCNLESKGLKGRAGPIRPRIAQELGLKPRDPYQKFVDTIQARMNELLEQAHKEAENGVQ